MKLEFEKREEVLDWVNAITDQINEDESLTESLSLLSIKENSDSGNDSDLEDGKYPIQMETQVDQVLRLVVNYIKIIEKMLKYAGWLIIWTFS